jgi:hypothetical protein
LCGAGQVAHLIPGHQKQMPGVLPAPGSFFQSLNKQALYVLELKIDRVELDYEGGITA